MTPDDTDERTVPSTSEQQAVSAADTTRGGAVDGSASDGSIDRRTYLSLLAATGVSLAPPGAATDGETVDDDAMTEVCAFVVNNTPDSYEAPVVVQFDSQSALGEFESEFVEEGGPETVPKGVVREEPTLAGHALLTADEVQTALAIDGLTWMDFSPGANPFWKLEGGYEDHVFPPAEEARGHFGFDEVVSGLEHLAETQPDLFDVTTVGSSPGWTDLVDDQVDPHEVYVARVSKRSGDPTQIPSVVYSVSIHGDERAGVEAACRMIDDIARGELPEFEEVLQEVQLVFVFSNPDGWVAREPRTEIDSIGKNRAFMRGNASGVDTNRQYPTAGWINPEFYPAEPTDAPEWFGDIVPDALAIVDHLREYEEVRTLVDYHGMYTEDYMILDLMPSSGGGHRQQHAMDSGSSRLVDRLLTELESTTAIEDDIKSAIETEYPRRDPDSNFPDGERNEGLYDFGTSVDAIGYEVTGGLLDWAAADEEFGGLGTVSVVPEIILSNNFPSRVQTFKPYMCRHLVTAYRQSMEAFGQIAVTDIDATVATGNQTTGYLRTEDVVRSSDDLPFTGQSAESSGSSTDIDRVSTTVDPDSPGVTSVTVESTARTTSLYLRCDGFEAASSGSVELVDPDGNVVHTLEADGSLPSGPDGCLRGSNEHLLRHPAPGDWTVRADADRPIDVSVTALRADDHPDPREAWDGDGFAQREYESDPLQFFEDLDDRIEDDGRIDSLGPDAVRNGALSDYDQFVLTHDPDAVDDAFLDALGSFVENGGDLLLTDAGVSLLADLEAGPLSDIGSGDINRLTTRSVALGARSMDDELLQGVAPQQRELWTAPPVGYTSGGDSPVTNVNQTAFENAGGTVAGTTSGGVGAGRIPVGDGEVAVIASILPPAQQDVLHPFGLDDYAVTLAGRTILCNALGFEQRRYEDGELVETIGDAPPTVQSYADADGVVRTDGLRSAVDDWRDGSIDTDLLMDVLDAWRSGDPVA